MSSEDKYNVPNVNLSDNQYKIKQNLIRNKYTITDKDGNVVLRGKQEMLKMKEKFPFVNEKGEKAFTVKAGGIVDIAGNYTIYNDTTQEKIVVLDEELSFLVENWKIRDPQTEDVIATIESKNKILSALRHLSDVANFIPNKYEIFNAHHEKIGEIAGEFSMKDTYTVTVDKSADVPREAVMASACIIDALENN